MLSDHLIHLVTLQRPTTTPDSYNNRAKTWATLATGVKGRLVIDS